jgi:ArsR family transcriptional regulator, arsenate/arsenite/antimonite-responsive transcriptional repressor
LPEHIGKALCVCYTSGMPSRIRPADCNPTVLLPDPISAGERDRLVAVFRALGDPTRLEVYRLIAAQPDPLCVCDVVSRFEVSQPTISHHLKILREAGLVTVSRRGVWAYYGASPSGLDVANKALAALAPERRTVSA